MQGVLVVLVPVLVAGFALVMDRFEGAVLSPTSKRDAAADEA